MSGPLQEPEVQHQHSQHEEIEKNPEEWLVQLNFTAELSESALVGPPPFALLPRLPHPKSLHQFIEMRFLHRLLDLCVVEART